MAERIIVTERVPDPGQQWKCGDEFLPFHPQSSVVPAEYRDGWNRCYWMAVTIAEHEKRAGLIDAITPDNVHPCAWPDEGLSAVREADPK